MWKRGHRTRSYQHWVVYGKGGEKYKGYRTQVEGYGKQLGKGKNEEKWDIEPNYQQRQITTLKGKVKKLKKHIQLIEQGSGKQSFPGQPQSRYSKVTTNRQGMEGSSTDHWEQQNKMNRQEEDQEI